MAGKVNSRKSKAKLHDAITLNGEAQETSDTATPIQEMGPAIKDNAKVEEADDVEEATSSKEISGSTNSKGLKRKASEISEENIDTSVQDSPAHNNKESNPAEVDSLNDSSVDSQTRKSGRKIRPKKPKTAYDDSPIHKSEPDKVEIKEEPMDDDTISDNPALNQPDSTDRPSSQLSLKSEDGTSVDSPLSGKNKVKADLTNPLFREPMALGWKRELVFRATLDNKNRRQGDIYYYTPTGKKLRSSREIADHLSDGLTLENFSFAKEPLGLNDPLKEIIRDARNIKARSSTGGSDSPIAPTVTTPSSVLGKRTPKPKLPKGASPPPVASETPVKISPKKSPKSFKVKLTNARLSGNGKTLGIKTKVAEKKSISTDKPQKSAPDTKPEKTKKVSPATVTKKTTTKSSNVREVVDGSASEPLIQRSENSTKEQCSIQCLKAMGMIPTLQCQMCLCLYHYECVGIDSEHPISNYKCMKCHDKPTEDIGDPIPVPLHSTDELPPLTPITSLKSHIPASASPPRLQRIPRPGEKNHTPKLIIDNKDIITTDTSTAVTLNSKPLVEKNKIISNKPRLLRPGGNGQTKNGKSLLGSVTTWLPSSSSIQMSKPSTYTDTRPTTSQGIALFAGKKYIVVPKHNVLSVFPAQTSVDNNDSKSSEKALGSISITTVSASSLDLSCPEKDVKSNISSNDKEIDKEMFDSDSNPVTHIPSQPNSTLGNAAVADSCTDPDNSTSDEPTTRRKVPHETAPAQDDIQDTPPPKTSTANAVPHKTGLNSLTKDKVDKQIAAPAQAPFVQHFCLNVSAGYFALLKIFQYLKVQELLRASRVCRLWNEMSNSPSLWKTVRMKNSQVGDWKGFAKSLQKHQTKNLDLRKMLIPAAVNPDDMWKQFSENIGLAESLVSIDFCRCPAKIIESLCNSNPNMQVINAVTIRDDKLNLTPFSTLKNLRELRLKSSGGFEIQKDLSPLRELKNLRHLSVTSVKELGIYGCDVIGELVELQSLELGECNDFPEDFGTNVLNKLQKLERLRLEKGQGNCYTFSILECVSKLPLITQLELVNFDIKTGFDKSLALCTNIRRMLIIPTYITQSATTNQMVLSGVTKLSPSLTHFVWGVTLELLRVTELFVDQYENSNLKEKKPLTESIPVLKPVPSLAQSTDEKSDGTVGNSAEAPQVEILTLQALQKLLNGSLPQTRVRILKIPFHATWRQSISDTQ